VSRKNERVIYEGCTTTAIIRDDGGAVIARGVAHWNPSDRYDKQLGKTIALGRARKNAESRVDRRAEGTRPMSHVLFADGLLREEFTDLMRLACEETDRDGLCFVHFDGRAPARYALLTRERYEALCRRIFGDEGIPLGDSEWLHTHVEPEMLEDTNVMARGVH
jgi:hypothetical protein